MNWLLPSLPEGWSICSFHYFVDWSTDPLEVAGPFLMTRLVEFDGGEDPDNVDSRSRTRCLSWQRVRSSI